MKKSKIEKGKRGLNSGWVIRWAGIGAHTASMIKKYSPQGSVVCILNSRRDFDDVFEYAKNLYILSTCSLSEKLQFAQYINGKKLRKDFLSRQQIYTYSESYWFKEYLEIEKMNPSNSKIVGQKFMDIFKDNSRYAEIGHNPYLEIREVFNLKELKSIDSGINKLILLVLSQ